MSRSHPLALVLAAALTAALAPAALASPAAPAKADHAKAEHDRIVAYWTPERMRAAKPRDFVRQNDGSFRLAPTPKAKPTKPPADGGGTTTTVPITSGASWAAGGEVLARTGKVYFEMGGAGYVCSGSVADGGAQGTSLILTAAHCVYDHVDGFATRWLFIPAFDVNPDLSTAGCYSKRTRYGCWTAKSLVAHFGFTSERDFTTKATTHDFAFAVVGLGGKSGTVDLDGMVGSYPLDFDVDDGSRLTAFGYPAAAPYNGRDLTYCSGSIGRDEFNTLDSEPNTVYTGPDDPWRMTCGMTGGSSGGPWLVTEQEADESTDTMDASGNGGVLGSLNSYGYGGYPYMFGPVFDSKARAVWDAASVLSTSNETPTGLVVSD